MMKAKRGPWSYRIALISLVGVFGIALSACGGGTSGSSSANSATTSQNSSSTPGSTTSSAGASTSSTGTTVTTNGPNVTLGWNPPTENTDGTALTDLVGYKIYYGTESQTYTQTVTVANPGLATYVVQNLPTGNTYYFAVTAYNSSGLESLLSDEVSAAVN
jgi:hypothetical protein